VIDNLWPPRDNAGALFPYHVCTIPHAPLYGMGSMLGAGIYGLIGKAAGSLGNGVWMAFLVAMIAAMLTGLSYACVGSRYPKAAGAAYVTHHAFNLPLLSYAVGIAVMMSGLTSMATGSQLIANNLLAQFGWTVPAQWIAIAVVFLIGLVIDRGIRESMGVNILCTIIEAAGLIFIIAVGMRFWGSVDYLEVPPAPAGQSTWSSSALTMLIVQGAVLTFYSFIGFEDLLNVSEEVKDAPRTLPRGLIAAMIGSTVIYMLVAITAVSVQPWQQLAESKAPLMDVARTAAPWFANIDKVYAVITIFSIGNTALLNYLMGSRLLYGMSRQGLLPKVLSTIHPVRHTPHIAVRTLFVIVALLILSGSAEQLAVSTVLLLLLVFTIVNAALAMLQRRSGEPRGQFEVAKFVPIAGAITCAALIVVRLSTAFSAENPEQARSPLIAGGILLAALLLYRVLKPTKAVADEVIPDA
jgi:basic amino acid/polyamine antiporter, APA family